MMIKELINELETLTWPLSRVGEAIQAVALEATLLSESPPLSPAPVDLTQLDERSLNQWVKAVAKQVGIEAKAFETSYNDVLETIRRAPPALLRLPTSDADVRFLALAGKEWGRMKLIGPDLEHHRLPAETIRAALTTALEAPIAKEIDTLLTETAVPLQRQARAKETILREQLGKVQLRGGWLLELSPTTNFWQQLRKTKLPTQMGFMLTAFTLQQAVVLVSGWFIIRGTLAKHFEPALLFGWGFLLLTTVLFQLVVLNSQREIVMATGALFKERLLFGTLQLKPEEIRHQGVGQFLGRVLESESVEGLALGGGFAAIISLIQLISAMGVLIFGTGGLLHAFLLLLWVILTLLLGVRYYYQSQKWFKNYREMTNDLVEHMVGHRTRLAQEDFEHWHDEEDQILTRYLELSSKIDRIGIQLSAFINRGWLILALASAAPIFIAAPTASLELAVILGGILLASAALSSLTNGMLSVIQIANAWEQFGPLFQAAERPQSQLAQAPTQFVVKQNQPLILARQLTFRYREESPPVLSNCNLRIAIGERLLLEGPSGGGKSTLAALLSGLRHPQSGLLLLHGLDMDALGEDTWRQRIISAPQFHENHVLTETFAFNLLMGRGWPPSPQDLADAQQICHELGLGDLLERMPSGMQQMVGESGWRLSHGERSRLFIARALLQQADLIILDESFAALDPENLERALRCVLKRARTLLVIAHP